MKDNKQNNQDNTILKGEKNPNSLDLEKRQDLIDLGVSNLNIKESKVDTSMRSFIKECDENGYAISNITNVLNQIDSVGQMLFEEAKNGKKILLVATTNNVANYLEQLTYSSEIAYVSSRWVPGLLTNWDNVKKEVYKKDLSPKREKQYQGLKALNGSKPDVILIYNGNAHQTALSELTSIAANKIKSVVITNLDTNVKEIKTISQIIPMNCETITVSHILLDYFVEQILKGKKIFAQNNIKNKKIYK